MSFMSCSKDECSAQKAPQEVSSIYAALEIEITALVHSGALALFPAAAFH